MKAYFAALLLGLSALSVAHAEQAPTYERIAFSVKAAQEVPNDMLTAVLYAEQQGQDTAALANTVNQTTTWALDIAKQANTVTSRTLDYTTNPIYGENGKVSGWQVRQSIQLKSQDSKALSGLLGQLQEKLRIEGISYSVSPDVQASTEKALIDQALKTFKERAEQMKTGMGRQEYRVVRLDVQAANDYFQPPIMMRAMADAAPAAAPAPPSLEGGKQNLQVNVQAEIELSIN